ncbi:hypothetical protein J2754_001076 [Halarchaeum solikamskense]|uniref:hypothetical protein n=1 Tax=Halarchaeum nitratireducens TaxID=489913 RepID=UPI001B3AC534|nr:hypothetical protein [Halarchaeum solikamskense]MBP2250759.1 hypothetical protein [Halarchaeum solikamskense]
MLTLEDENALIEDIKEGIDIAIYKGIQKGRFSEEDVLVDSIRLNKLAYLAIQDRDLDITFGWFKYGPAPVGTVSTDTAGQHLANPRPTNEIAAHNESRIPNSGYLSSEGYAYYFLKDLEEFDKIITSDSTKQMLVDFYQTYCPKDAKADRFTDLYVASAKLQQTLDQVGDGVSWHANKNEIYKKLDRRIGELEFELEFYPELEEAVGPFQEYIRVLKDILAEATEKEDLSQSQQRFISRIVGFYYNYAWKYVSLLISRNTIRGDNASQLRNSTDDDLTEIRDSYERELTALRNRAELFDLSPEEVESGAGDIEPEETAYIERWTSLSAEVIQK